MFKSKMHVTRRGVHNGSSKLQEQRCFHLIEGNLSFRDGVAHSPLPEKPPRLDHFSHRSTCPALLLSSKVGLQPPPRESVMRTEVLDSEAAFAHCLKTASFIFLALFFSYV